VFLGGHSWGATIALAYAAWDFQGKPGYRDLKGLILVDGGVHDSWVGEGYKFRLTAADVAEKLKRIETGNPFTGDLGYIWQLEGPPEELPIYYQLAAVDAQKDPHGASPLQELLPKAMQPPSPVTNLALFGWLRTRTRPPRIFRFTWATLPAATRPSTTGYQLGRHASWKSRRPSRRPNRRRLSGIGRGD
jgi:pimeloyl-ACP methyl ester carboxylesterase